MKIQPVLNVPMQLALQDPAGDYHPEAEEVTYLTTDGRELVLETRTAERLNALFLRPGEAFHLCRRWDGSRGTLPRFDFWLAHRVGKGESSRGIGPGRAPDGRQRARRGTRAPTHGKTDADAPAPPQGRSDARPGSGRDPHRARPRKRNVRPGAQAAHRADTGEAAGDGPAR